MLSTLAEAIAENKTSGTTADDAEVIAWLEAAFSRLSRIWEARWVGRSVGIGWQGDAGEQCSPKAEIRVHADSEGRVVLAEKMAMFSVRPFVVET